MRKSGRKVMLLMLVSSIMTMFGVAGDVIGSGRAAAAESDFSGGNGTIDSPYLVGNADQLARLGSSRYVDRRYYFKQIADIDLSSHGNWTPIGSTNIPMGRFEGHLDGNGFRITGLTISGGDHAGLFSTIGGSTYSPSSMTNVRLDHVNVTGNDYVGGLAGELSSVTVNNCIVTGNVTGVDDVGGLTGWLDGTINDSAASVNVTGSHYHTGGLVGVNSGTINGSYASGRVSGGAIATGGLAGQQYSGSINNSYASGSVSGNSQVGGLIGIQDGGSIGNSYASGSVGGNSYVGGLSGRWTRGSNDNSFYDMESTGQSASAGGTGKLTAAMKDRSTYEEDIDHQWDFNNVWVIDPSLNNGYPDLQAMISVAASFDSNGGSAVASQTVKYNGTAAAPSIPTKNGYKFEGWYSDRELTQAFLFTTQMTSDVTLYAKWMSTNADLSNLTLSSGTLDPVFASEVTSYTASVGYAVENVTVTPTVADTTATVKVNGTDMTGSSPSGTVNLNVGANTVTVLVTAEDGATKKTYTITVTREPSSNIDLSSNADLSNLTLSSGTLDPVFASEVTSYTASVGYAVENVTVTPTVADTTATVKVNGIDVASGLPGGAVNLSVGANVITVLVTAEDGATKKTYTITVTREPSSNVDLSSNADLSSLTLSSGTLDPVFASDTTSYTASVGNAVENVTVTPTVADTTSTVKVNGTDATSGLPGGAVNLSVGANVITVLVTAEDGTQQQTYTITVTRAPSSNATLSSLTVSDVTLDPAFNSGTISYTASAANSVTSTTVTPTASDDTASVAVAVDGGAGTSITDGKPSAAIPLSVGPNTITVVVKAEDDSTTTTYTITVTRAGAGSNNNGGGFIPPSDNNVPAINGALTLPPGQAGKVSLGDAIMIAIPADATDKELRITIAKIADTQKLLTKTDVPASQVYEVAKNFPENFSKPVTLSMAFDPASLKSNQTAAVFYYDEGKQEWVEVVGGKIDGNHITVEVDHLAKFSVFPVSPVRQAGTGSVEAPTKPVITFSDISGHWAEANIKQAAGEGMVTGFADGTFKPNRIVTRAEFAVMLMNALQLQDNGAKLTFTDAAEIGAWARKAVAQAAGAGIITGREDGTFRPNAEITRAEMAMMVARALNLAVETNAAAGFADDKDIPAWAKGAAAALKRMGIIDGKGGNKFDPQAAASRAEAVTVLLQMKARMSK